MQATIPHVEVQGDNESKIMARDGSCVGMSDKLAVWRFGYTPRSHHAVAHNVCRPYNRGFLWVLATRKTGKIKETREGYAISLPKEFRRVIEWLPKKN